MIQLNYRDARPIYAQITDGFREQILSGVLLEGEKLPSVRELATSLAINPNTIQRAYRQLELSGWIATVPGKGCFVCGNADARTKKKEQLLLTFDDTVAELACLGVSREALLRRLQEDTPC